MGEWFEDWFDADYARLYAHRDAEEARTAVATALREAPELARGPVLDLGCGAGRHLEALARVNPEALGLDLSAPLLALAPVLLRPRLVRGDMRTLPFRPGAFQGICLWFTPFGYFDDDANRALLADLARLARPGGVLLLDYLNAAHAARTLVPEDTVARDGIRAHSRRSLEGDRLVKRITLTRLADGCTREALESVRLYTPAEVESLAEGAGWRLRRSLGDYGGAPFAPDSPRWIGIFGKP